MFYSAPRNVLMCLSEFWLENKNSKDVSNIHFKAFWNSSVEVATTYRPVSYSDLTHWDKTLRVTESKKIMAQVRDMNSAYDLKYQKTYNMNPAKFLTSLDYNFMLTHPSRNRIRIHDNTWRGGQKQKEKLFIWKYHIFIN